MMSTEQQAVCPVRGVACSPSRVVMAGDYRVAYIAKTDSWTTLDNPDAAALRAAYQSFNAGQIARANFDAYRLLSRQILKNEFSIAGFSPDKLNGLPFLDYGCGGGHFVAAASDLGLHATGLELDEESVRLACQKGLDVRSGTLPDKELAAGLGKFDIIKIMHVLEHVPSPSSLIESFVDLLSPGGALFISVPDQSSVPSRIKILLRSIGIKRKEFGFVQPPIHLHGFSIQSFESLSSHFGLELLACYRTSPLDSRHFPTVPAYWHGLGAQRVAYELGRLMGSGGHLTAVFRKARLGSPR